MKKKVDANAPKKPRTAYLLFSEENRKSMVEKHPNANAIEIVKMLAAHWTAMSESEKQPYVQKQEAARTEYEMALKK